MTGDEGRVSRWSRLKRKGGANPHEEAEAEAEAAAQIVSKTASRGDGGPVAATHGLEVPGMELMPDPASLPGGKQSRNFAPAMRPLAEPDDNDLPYEAAPPEALALLDVQGDQEQQPGDGDSQDGVEEEADSRELTPEEEEVVRNLPPIETLTKDSDFTPFMAEKVPAFIRRRALKLLWRSDPAFALIDGLDDYDEDFSLAKLVGKLISDTKNVSKRHEAGADDDRMAEEEESVGAEGDDQERVDEDMDSAKTGDIATAEGDDNETNAPLPGAVGTDANPDDTGEGEDEG